jgi:hypothetical protein
VAIAADIGMVGRSIGAIRGQVLLDIVQHLNLVYLKVG